jgi:hypothetical protein
MKSQVDGSSITTIFRTADSLHSGTPGQYPIDNGKHLATTNVTKILLLFGESAYRCEAVARLRRLQPVDPDATLVAQPLSTENNRTTSIFGRKSYVW